MHLSALSQRILKRLDCPATLAGPKAKHDAGQVNHVTVSNRTGSLALRYLQLDDPIYLFKPWLNPLRLFEPRVWNHCPTAFTILQQPLHRPMIDPARSANQPGSTLRQEWSQLLLEKCARCFAINVARSNDHDGTLHGQHSWRKRILLPSPDAPGLPLPFCQRQNGILNMAQTNIGRVYSISLKIAFCGSQRLVLGQ